MDVIEMLCERIKEEKKQKERAIVFWYDPSAQETEESLQAALANEHVSVRELTENNFFKLKIEIEIEHPEMSYLLYAPFSRPADEENFLLDMLLYGTEFKADQIAIWAEQLSVPDVVLRSIVNRYPIFFNSRERREKLKKVLCHSPKEEDIEYGMLAVITGSPLVNISLITRYLLMAGIDTNSNVLFEKIEKLFSVNRLWEIFEQYFGLRLSEEQRTPRYLMELLLYTHFTRDAEVNIKAFEKKYVSTRGNICAVFIDDWMNGKPDEVIVLETYIKELESMFNIRHYLLDYSVETYDKATTFPLIEDLLLGKVVDELLHKTANLEAWKKRISYRLLTHWGQKTKVASLYRTLYEAVCLFDYKEYVNQYDTRSELYGQYGTKLYKIDQAYRRFMQSYSGLEIRESIDSLQEMITNWYENVYLRKLADETNYFLDNHQSSMIPKQSGFFKRVLQPILNKESTRVFVIISDALRYEVGAELCERLNGRINGEASLSPMQTSLPSYTQLGMASLLPHRNLTIGDNKTIYADGEPLSGIAYRAKILQAAHSDATAYRLKDFSDWTRTEAEEHFKGKRLIYLYHDVIDATGDSRKSERDTFAAAEKAIHDIELAVDRLSRLQAKRIFITADHGFLFQYPKIGSDVMIDAVTGHIFDSNRRFAVGKALSVPHGSIKLTEEQSALSDVETVLAKGLNRFTSGGGLQYVHGGAMPQEVIIPLIDYRRTGRAELVEVSVAMLDKVITNYRVPVSFYQEESISSDYLPRRIKAAFYINNERISNEMTVEFNLSGENHQRTNEFIFTLAERHYAMGQICTLKVETVLDKTTEVYKEETFTIRMYDALY